MEPPVCPRCEAANKPDSVRCRRCGERLRESDRTPVEKEPVVLQRVMSGEIFSAILGGGPGTGEGETATPDAEETPPDEAPTEKPEEPAAARDPAVMEKLAELEDLRRMLQDYEARLKRREEELDALVHRIQRNPPLEAWAPEGGATSPARGASGAAPSGDATGPVEGDTIHGDEVDALRDRLQERERTLLAREQRLNVILRRLFPAKMARIARDTEGGGGDHTGIRSGDPSLWTTDKLLSVDALLEGALDGPLPSPDEIDFDPEDLAIEGGPLVAAKMEVQVSQPRLLRTFVTGLDAALDGGVPEGHVVLLTGAPGTLKSTLGYWILHANAIHQGIPGLFVTLEQSLESLRRHLGTFGMTPEEETAVSVFDIGFFQKEQVEHGESWLRLFKRRVEALTRQRGIRIAVIDSLNAMEVLASFEDRRHGLFQLFQWFRGLGLTVFLTAERGDFLVNGNVLQPAHVEDFLCDGLIHLRLHMTSDTVVQRRIRCTKMRGVKHENAYLSLLWDDARFKVSRAMMI